MNINLNLVASKVAIYQVKKFYESIGLEIS